MIEILLFYQRGLTSPVSILNWTKREGGGTRSFTPTKSGGGGGGKSFSHAEGGGGHNKFWGKFYTVT